MPGKSDLGGFFALPVSLTLERILVVDFLLAKGLLPGDLDDLPSEQSAALLAEARRFARHRLGNIEQPVVFSPYVSTRFSLN